MHDELELDRGFVSWLQGRLTDDRLGWSATIQRLHFGGTEVQRLIAHVLHPEDGLDFMPVGNVPVIDQRSIDR
jgi:hypothetical protein